MESDEEYSNYNKVYYESDSYYDSMEQGHKVKDNFLMIMTMKTNTCMIVIVIR